MVCGIHVLDFYVWEQFVNGVGEVINVKKFNI